jgi:hypothetical protein
MIKAMPYKLGMVACKALLGICWIHGNVEMGEPVAKQILESEPGNGELVTCCYETSMLLLAMGISVRMLNGRERKEV